MLPVPLQQLRLTLPAPFSWLPPRNCWPQWIRLSWLAPGLPALGLQGLLSAQLVGAWPGGPRLPSRPHFITKMKKHWVLSLALPSAQGPPLPIPPLLSPPLLPSTQQSCFLSCASGLGTLGPPGIQTRKPNASFLLLPAAPISRLLSEICILFFRLVSFSTPHAVVIF